MSDDVKILTDEEVQDLPQEFQRITAHPDHVGWSDEYVLRLHATITTDRRVLAKINEATSLHFDGEDSAEDMMCVILRALNRAGSVSYAT